MEKKVNIEKIKRGRFLKRVKRLKEIVSLIYKYSIASYFIKLPFPALKKKKIIDKLPIQVRLRLLFEELGPSFIKIAQFLSTQYDLMPKEFCDEFRKLQDQVQPFPFETTKEIVESELKKPINEVFDEFNEVPVASASLSQVHKARLKSGDVVAVKVQRPNIEETIELDFDLLVYITKFIKNRSKVLKSMNITEMVKEARVAIMKELEFTKEISNIEKLYDNLRDDSNVKIPKPYRDLTTSKVLVMEFIDGIKITDMERINELGLDKKKIISNLIKSIYRQILRDGFFHGDPHPANVFVLKDGRIAFLDFGMVGYMDQQNKESYIKQSIALSSGNSLDFIKVYTQNNNFDMNSLDLETLEHEIDKLTLGWFKQEIKSNGEFYYKVLMLMFQNGVGTSNQIVVLSKCLLTLSSLVRIYEVSNEESIQIFLEALGEEKVARDTIMKQGLTKYLTDFYNNGMELFVSSLGALRDFVGRREQ